MGEIMESKIRKKDSDEWVAGGLGVGIYAVKSQAGSCVRSARRRDEE